MKDASKDRKGWKQDYSKAENRLDGLGGALEWSDVAHEVARWVAPDLTLIFYSHKTSAGNYHIRVRAGRCKDRDLLKKCIYALAENSCSFQFPTEAVWHREGVRQALREAS